MRLMMGDCLERMGDIDSGRVDMVMCDPPYGTTGVACVNLAREFIGIERDDKYFAIAERRIAEAAAAKAGELF